MYLFSGSHPKLPFFWKATNGTRVAFHVLQLRTNTLSPETFAVGANFKAPLEDSWKERKRHLDRFPLMGGELSQVLWQVEASWGQYPLRDVPNGQGSTPGRALLGRSGSATPLATD